MSLSPRVPSPDETLPSVRPTAEQASLGFRLRHAAAKLSPTRVRENTRSRLETRLDHSELIRLRGTHDVVWADDPEPLVTVRIATYSAGERLRVAIESALRQTYQRVEVLVVGDHCDEATAAVARSYEDRGVRFINLPRRGQYPAIVEQRWMVAGATPMNAALDLANGTWIAPCDDDDMLTDNHVELLVRHALSERLELVWSRAALQMADGSWVQTEPVGLVEGQISHGSVLYATELRFMRYNVRSYLSGRPADWELWRRMSQAGVRMGYLDALTYYHFA